MINNTVIKRNWGQVASIQAENQLNFKIINATITNNNATEALFYVSSNALLMINDSVFEENFSIGRGSIIFVDQKSAVA